MKFSQGKSIRFDRRVAAGGHTAIDESRTDIHQRPTDHTSRRGIRSLNVALRQKLDLYACVRPVRWYTGTPSPVKQPEAVDMVIFRENSEDVYAGIEWESGSEGAKRVIEFLQRKWEWIR